MIKALSIFMAAITCGIGIAALIGIVWHAVQPDHEADKPENETEN